MFDISSGEILLVCVVGLIVIGPKRLPVAITECSKAIRAIKVLMSNAKTEMERELEIQDLEHKYKLVEELRNKKVTEMSADIQKYLFHKNDIN